jgi:hypothetical protein
MIRSILMLLMAAQVQGGRAPSTAPKPPDNVRAITSFPDRGVL